MKNIKISNSAHTKYLRKDYMDVSGLYFIYRLNKLMEFNARGIHISNLMIRFECTKEGILNLISLGESILEPQPKYTPKKCTLVKGFEAMKCIGNPPSPHVIKKDAR